MTFESRQNEASVEHIRSRIDLKPSLRHAFCFLIAVLGRSPIGLVAVFMRHEFT